MSKDSLLILPRISSKVRTTKESQTTKPRIQQDWTPIARDIAWEVDSDTVKSIRSEGSYDDCAVRLSLSQEDGEEEVKPK